MGIRFLKGLVPLFLIPFTLSLSSCGGNTQIFDSATLVYDDQEDEIVFTVFLADTLEFPVGLTLPIEDYGDVTIIPSINGEPAMVILRANLDIIGIGGYLVTTLPNGFPFPYFVNGPLIEVRIKKRYYVYISPDNFEQIGFAVQIPAIDDDWPEGLMLTTHFKNADSEVIGAGALFGPGHGNPGGIFAVADPMAVIDKVKSMQKADGIIVQDASTPFTFKYQHLKSLQKGGYLQ